MKVKHTFFLLLIVTLGCKDEFLLESRGYKKVLVVDGLITNEPGPYTIELSTTAPINFPEKYPYENCEVILYENDSNSEILTETEPGIYQTSEDGIMGAIGNIYSISIKTPNGNEYVSPPITLSETLEIDTVYAELTYQEDLDYEFGLPGYQFYVSSETATKNDVYILWKLEETYEYTAIHELYGIYDDRGLHLSEFDLLTEYQNKYRCWKTEMVKNVFAGKTLNLSIPKITDQPLHFVGTDTRKLQQRYSILLKQYAIDENSYTFWKKIENQIAEDNLLFATQPYDIKGNLKCLTNPGEEVYGNFTVGSVSKQRIFVDVPSSPLYFTQQCAVNYEDYTRLPRPVFIVIGPKNEIGAVKEACIDCTYFGGVTEKPNFWIDK